MSAEEQAVTTLTALRMQPVHESAVQLRVEAVALAIQAIDKPRWGSAKEHEKKTAPDFDAELLATARAIHAFLVEAS